jgi:hypothetical protein
MVGVTDVVAAVGTYLVFAAFLTLTAHIAARNVMGDVRVDRALLVGPATAAVSFAFVAALGPRAWVPALAVPSAVAVDVAAIRRSYEVDWRLAGYVTLIHAVVTVLLGTVVISTVLLLTQGPSGTPPGG